MKRGRHLGCWAKPRPRDRAEIKSKEEKHTKRGGKNEGGGGATRDGTLGGIDEIIPLDFLDIVATWLTSRNAERTHKRAKHTADGERPNRVQQK